VHIKSYFVDTVEKAIAQAREELGREALLITSRKAPPQSAHLGAYEVVFGVAGGDDAPAQPSPAPAEPSQRGETPEPLSTIAAEMNQLRSQLAELRSAVQQTPAAEGPFGHSAELAALYTRLIEKEFTPAVARHLVARIGQEPGAPPRLHQAVRAELQRMLRIAPAAGDDAAGAIALIGPAGSGKTTSLVKLAIHRGLAQGRGVRILSLDTDRVGGNEQLQTYADILGAAYVALGAPAALEKALAANRRRDLILIDTPGTPASPQSSAELAAAFRSAGEIEMHLTLPAYMKSADLRRAIERFEEFGANRVLATHVDETQSLASMFSELTAKAKSFSYLSSGPAIPEDLEMASEDRVLDLLWAPEKSRAEQCAA
jgi:flagellar biosynthesis protein FlhF